jgi:hypothetical protein
MSPVATNSLHHQIMFIKETNLLVEFVIHVGVGKVLRILVDSDIQVTDENMKTSSEKQSNILNNLPHVLP